MITHEYGHWVKLHKGAPLEDMAAVQLMLHGILAKQMADHGLALYVAEIKPWDLEGRYGRAELRLADDEIAVGVHVQVEEAVAGAAT